MTPVTVRVCGFPSRPMTNSDASDRSMSQVPYSSSAWVHHSADRSSRNDVEFVAPYSNASLVVSRVRALSPART